MLKLLLAFIQNELNHNAGDQGHRDSHHEGKVSRACSALLILEHLIDRERCGDDIELKVGLTRSDSQDRVVDVLRVHARHILRGHVEEVYHLVQILSLVCLKYLVAAVAIGEGISVLPSGKHCIIELCVVQVIMI